MKKYLLTIISFMCFVASVTAQVSKGTVVVNGNVGYTNSSRTTTFPDEPSSLFHNTQSTRTEKDLYLSPGLGFFLADNLEIGIAGTYGHENILTKNRIRYYGNNYDYTGDYREREFGFRSYGRKYFFLTERFAFLAIASASFSKYTRKSSTTDIEFLDAGNATIQLGDYYDYKRNSYSAALSPGISLFISEKFNLNATLGALEYSNMQQSNKIEQEENYSQKSNHLGFNFSPENLGVGISYFINR